MVTAVIRVTTRHVDGSMGEFDARQELLDDLRNLQAQGLEGKQLIHRLLTDVGSVLAIVIGIAAFNATVLSNMVASFESGRNTAQAVTESAKRVEEAAKAMERAAEASKQAPAPAPTKP